MHGEPTYKDSMLLREEGKLSLDKGGRNETFFGDAIPADLKSNKQVYPGSCVVRTRNRERTARISARMAENVITWYTAGLFSYNCYCVRYFL